MTYRANHRGLCESEAVCLAREVRLVHNADGRLLVEVAGVSPGRRDR